MIMLQIKNLAPREPGKHFSPEHKYNAVVAYLATGNLRIAAGACNISYETIKSWKSQPWWKEFEFEIANTKRTDVKNKLSKLVDKSLELLHDRLENGDCVLNQKTGEIIRRPVQIRDVNQVFANIMQRQEALEKQKKEESILQQQESVKDTLKMLAEEFAKFNHSRKPQVIDVEDVKEISEDAILEERKEGLQDGIPEVCGSPGSDQEAERTKPSTWGIGEGGISPQGGW